MGVLGHQRVILDQVVEVFFSICEIAEGVVGTRGFLLGFKSVLAFPRARDVLFPEALKTSEYGAVGDIFENFFVGRVEGKIFASSECMSLKRGEFVSKMYWKYVVQYRSVLGNGMDE